MGLPWTRTRDRQRALRPEMRSGTEPALDGSDVQLLPPGWATPRRYRSSSSPPLYAIALNAGYNCAGGRRFRTEDGTGPLGALEGSDVGSGGAACAACGSGRRFTA